jgi:hypothetical protein
VTGRSHEALNREARWCTHSAFQSTSITSTPLLGKLRGEEFDFLTFMDKIRKSWLNVRSMHSTLLGSRHNVSTYYFPDFVPPPPPLHYLGQKKIYLHGK